MRKTVIPLLFILLLPSVSPAAQYSEDVNNRTLFNFNTGWKYLIGDQSGAEAIGYDDSSWDDISLPHTLEQTPNADSGSVYRGHGWYRKEFTVESSWLDNKKLFLMFEGIMIEVDIYLNGSLFASMVSQYTPITMDITDEVSAGDNLIVLDVTNEDNSDIPPMGGLYDFAMHGGANRDAYLMVVDNLHVTDPIYADTVAGGGTFVSYSAVTSTQASVQVKTQVKNDYSVSKTCNLKTDIVDSANEVIATIMSSQSIAAGGTYTFTQNTNIDDPELWTPEIPNLYMVYSTVSDGATPVDVYETRIGIRKFEWKNSGFYLNGALYKMFGVNRHQCFPWLGDSLPNSGQYRDAVLIKEAGCNFVRCSHYPQDPAFIEACDELGLLVWEEPPGWGPYVGGPTWQENSIMFLRRMIRRFRNSPSIWCWGRINESVCSSSHNTDLGTAAHEEDTTRPSVGNVFELDDCSCASYMDVSGCNQFEEVRDPGDCPWMITEHTGHTYYTDRNHDEARLLEHANRWENMTAWERDEDGGGISGWCFVDYYYDVGGRREHGVSDHNRIPKYAYYFLMSQRDPDPPVTHEGVDSGPMVYIANFWTSSSPTTVRVYSNCEQVRLSRNGSVVGTQTPDTGKNLLHPAFTFTGLTWAADSYLTAEGLISSVVVASHTVYEPGTPEAITLVADRPEIYADGSDLSYINVGVVDSHGQVVPTATNSITYSVSGPASLIEDPAVERGRYLILARSTLVPGTIVVTATGSGLAQATVQVESVGFSSDPEKLFVHSEPTAIFGDGTSTALVMAEVMDEGSNRVDSATNQVTFSLSGGGALSGTNPVDASVGIATIALVSSSSAGTSTVTATSNGLMQGTCEVVMTAVPEKMIATASPASLSADGTGTSLVTANICDSSDNLVIAATNNVTFTLSGVGALLDSAAQAEGGQAVVEFKCTEVVGVAGITAASSGLTSDSVDITVNPIVDKPYMFVNTANPDSLLADGVSTTLVTSGVHDWFGTLLTDAGGSTWGGLSSSGGGVWNYRKEVTINNPGSALTDYQVLITEAQLGAAALVSGGKLESDFSDARFATGITSGTELDYWADSDSSGFMVLVPQLSAGYSTLYFYYGNSSASAVSDADAAMIMYDDFSTQDATRWSFGTATVSGGILYNDGVEVVSASKTVDDFRAEYRARSTTDECSFFWRGNVFGYAYGIHDWNATGSWCFAITLDDAALTNGSTPLTVNTWYVYEITMTGSSITCRRLQDGTLTELESVSTTDSSRTSGGFGFRVGVGRSQEVDWVKVYKHSSSSPSVSSVGSEEEGIFAVTFAASGQGTLLGSTSGAVVAGTATVVLQSTVTSGTAVVTASSPELIEMGTALVTVGGEGTPVKIVNTASPVAIIADGTESSAVTARICDSLDEVMTDATNDITFSVTAHGTLSGNTVK